MPKLVRSPIYHVQLLQELDADRWAEKFVTYLKALDCFGFHSETIGRLEHQATGEHCSDILRVFQETLMSTHADLY